VLFPDSFLDEIRARISMPSLIGRRVRISKHGRMWKACCPFHNERTPSFYVYDDHYHCFGCGAHGDAIEYLMKSFGLEFREAVEQLAGDAGMEIPKASKEEEVRARRESLMHEALLSAETEFYRRLRAPEGRAALDYLRKRGLTDKVIDEFRLGWAPMGRRSLVAELKRQGFEEDLQLEVGLARKSETSPEDVSDFFYSRIIFPIKDRRGRTIAFGGRVMGDGQPKYINSPDTPLFHKKRSLYGIHIARNAMALDPNLIVVEGYMDVIALNQAGLRGVVAPLGTAITEDHLQELWRLSPEPILCLDGDAAGFKAASRAASIALPDITPENSLKFMRLPEGEDPDTMILNRGVDAFREDLEAAHPMSAVLYGFIRGGRELSTPEQKASFRDRLTAAAHKIKNKTLAGEYRKYLLDKFYAETRAQRDTGVGKLDLAGNVSQSNARPQGTRPYGAKGHRTGAQAKVTPPMPAEAIKAGFKSVPEERVRILFAVLLKNRDVLPDADEDIVGLDLPTARCEDARAAILRLMEAERVSEAGKIATLEESFDPNLSAWLTQKIGLPKSALEKTDPDEVKETWSHFLAVCRGEDALLVDLAAAQQDFLEKNDAESQARLIKITQSLAAARSGDCL
jgi:DNA primase